MQINIVLCPICGERFEILKREWVQGIGMVAIELKHPLQVPAHQYIEGIGPPKYYRSSSGKIIQTVCDGAFVEDNHPLQKTI